MKPTERTLKYYRDKGYICDMVERFIKMPNHRGGGYRKDCFGFGDILAFHPDNGDLIMIQSCGSDYANHLRKLTASLIVYKWIVHFKLILISWRKVKKKRGGKQMVWRPRIKQIGLDDFD